MNLFIVSLKNLSRKRTRTAMLFGIVTVVVCALFGTSLFLSGINNALKLGSYRLGADILVIPQDAEAEVSTALLSGKPTHFLMDSSVLERVRKIEGVKMAAPQLFLKPRSITCCYNVDVFLIAFDPDMDFTVKPWLERRINRMLGLTEVITGSSIPVSPGDRLPFFGTSFVVAGTLEPTGMDFFDRTVFMSLDAAYAMAVNSKKLSPLPLEIGRDKISAVLIRLDDGYSADLAAIKIEHANPGVKALVSDTVIRTMQKQLRNIIKAVAFIGVVLWLILLMIMALAFSMIVNERRREIGLLRAMGANKTHIFFMMLSEVAALTAAGVLAGVGLGLGFLMVLNDILLTHLRLPYLFPDVVDTSVLVIGTVTITVVTGLLAALLPTLAVLRLEPYETIQSDE